MSSTAKSTVFTIKNTDISLQFTETGKQLRKGSKQQYFNQNQEKLEVQKSLTKCNARNCHSIIAEQRQPPFYSHYTGQLALAGTSSYKLQDFAGGTGIWAVPSQ